MDSFRLKKLNWNSPAKILAALVLLAHGYSSPCLALSWEEVKSMARNSPRLKSAEADVSGAQSSLDAAKAVYYPKIYSTLESSRSVDTELRKSSNAHSAAISLQQNLFSFGKDSASVQSADFYLEAARKSKAAASVTFRSELAKAWASALYQDKLREISAKVVERRKANIQIVRLRYNSGRESKGSLLSTEYAGREASIDAREAQERSKLARVRLSALAGSEIPADAPLVGTLTETSSLSAETSAAKLPQVQAAAAKIEAAKAHQSELHKKHLPDLSLSASAKKSANPDLPLNAPVYTAALTLSVPLFDARLSADERSAAAKLAGAEAELAAITTTAGHELESARLGLELATERLESARLGFEAAKLQAEVSRQRYTLGLMSFQDWDSYESAFIKAENKMLEQERVFAEARATYLESAGVSLEEGP
jgi:outer membrane protein TolC